MAKLRVFVSSTYYDLKHIRASLENFIESLGYEAVLSEKGDIAFTPDVALDESCYREVRNADIFVVIIGGRYGSEKSESKSEIPKSFDSRYDSITKEEFRNAIAEDIPVYVLIERSVYSDFETYLRNKNNKSINYAHVDSVNIFHLIEEILSLPRNNPIKQFDRYHDIEAWLREQWSGLFRDLLNRTSSQKQISSLSIQVDNLSEANKTLKRYLEEVVSKIAPDDAASLIQSESKRLDDARLLSLFRKSKFIQYLKDDFNVPPNHSYQAFLDAETTESFFKLLIKLTENNKLKARWIRLDLGLITHELNQIREELNLPPLYIEADKKAAKSKGRKSKQNK
jgi:hypothetical protein